MANGIHKAQPKKEEVKCTILEKCGVIGKRGDNSNLELRYIAWNEREPRYDIRPWYIDEESKEERCLKGITLSGEELITLAKAIIKLNGGTKGIVD